MTITRSSADDAVHPRRALLFVPAHRERYVASAAASGADGVVLDLEDSVPVDWKAAARRTLGDVVAGMGGVPLVVVRVNAGHGLVDDLVACRDASVSEILLPKVGDPSDVAAFDAICAQLNYRPAVSVLVENSAGLRRLDDILARPGIRTVALGVEDLRAEIEMHAPRRGETSTTIVTALAELVLSALAHRVTPLGIVGSIAELQDLTAFSRGAHQAFAMGMRGSYCIHPKQVPHLLRGFSPSPEDRDWARAVLAADREAAATGQGAFVIHGDMVDAPLVERARRILALPTPAPNRPQSAGTVSHASPATTERNPS